MIRQLLVIFALASAAHAQGPEISDADKVTALLETDLHGRAEELLPLFPSLPRALVEEVRLRAAFLREEDAAVRRQLLRTQPGPVVDLVSVGLQFDTGNSRDLEMLAQRGLQSLGESDSLTAWQLRCVLAAAYFGRNRPFSALTTLLGHSRGYRRLGWNPYQVLLAHRAPDHPDTPRLVEAARKLAPEGSAAASFAMRRRLSDGDLAGSLGDFLELAARRLPDVLASVTKRKNPRSMITDMGFVIGGGTKPPLARIWMEFGLTAALDGRRGEAERCMEAARLAGDLDDEGRWIEARIQMAIGEIEKGRVLLDPLRATLPEARSTYAVLLAATGNTSVAMRELALDTPGREPATVDERYVLAQALLAEKDFDHAWKRLEVPGPGDRWFVRYWMARAEAAQGRGDQEQVLFSLDQLAVLGQLERASKQQLRGVAARARELGGRRIGLMLEDIDRTPFRRKVSRGFFFAARASRLFADSASEAGDVALGLRFLEVGRHRTLDARLAPLGLDHEGIHPSLQEFMLAASPAGFTAMKVSEGRILVEQDRAQEALDCLLPAIVNSDTSPGVFLLTAAALGQLGRRDDMNAMTATSVQLVPDHERAWEGIGLLLALGGAEEAIHWLVQRSWSRDPARPPSAETTALAGLAGLALEVIEQPPSVDPVRQLGRGLAWRSLGRVDQARECLIQARTSGGTWSAEAFLALVELEIASENLAAAAQHMTDMESGLQATYITALARAALRLARAEKSGSLEAARQAVALAPLSGRAHLAEARALEAMDDRAGAARALEQARRVGPILAEAHEMARRLEAAGSPAWIRATRQAARAHLMRGDLTRARDLLRDLIPFATTLEMVEISRKSYFDPTHLAAAYVQLVERHANSPSPWESWRVAREGAFLTLEAGAVASAADLLGRIPDVSGTAEQIPLEVPPPAGPSPVASALVILLALLLLPPLTTRLSRE